MKDYIDIKINELESKIVELENTILELREYNALLGKQITGIKSQNEEIITEFNILKEGGNL